MLRLGLTGGIGSGKSTVARMLKALGASVVDADDIARQCTLPGGAAIPAIARTFGHVYIAPDGAMDRARMRAHVFSHPEAKRQLESIVHPLVQQEMQRQAALVTSACVVFDIPLLVEVHHWRLRLDRILVVDCLPETQVQRVMARNEWTREQVLSVIEQQSLRSARIAAADWVVHNDRIDLDTLQVLLRRLTPWLGL